MTLSTSVDPLPPTTILNGHYTIECVIGEGTFGITYLARRTDCGTPVAIKELAPLGCRREGAAVQVAHPAISQSAFELGGKKFRDHARMLARLEHPNVVRVLDEFEENGTAYMVMEALDGVTLATLVEADGPLPVDLALHYIDSIGHGLEAIHRAQLLHLDLKPENIMLCGERLVLLDFDLVQRWDETERTSTQPLTLTSHSGTPGYAPLEQYSRDARLGPWTDLYALGATLRFLVSGRAPIEAVDRANGFESPAATALEGDRHGNAGHALTWALEIEAGRRPQRVRDFLEALHAAPSTIPADSTSAPLYGSIAFSAPSAPDTEDGQSSEWSVIALLQPAPDWPHRCMCCCGQSELVLPIKSHGQVWRVPYCMACWNHVRAARKALVVAGWGMGIGLAVALTGVLTADLYLGPIGVIIHFSGVFYGCLKTIKAEAKMSKTCCDKHLAFAYDGHSGDAHLLRLRSPRYADMFRKVNQARLA